MLNYSEDELLLQLNAGSMLAFESVFHSYYPSLCYFATKITHDSEVSRDLVQEVFIYFWEKTTKFETLIALKSYLYVCVQNRALNHIEKESNRERIRGNIESEHVKVDELSLNEIESEVIEHIFHVIEELPLECRKVFKMSYLERLDVKSISENLGIAASTVMTQRQRAKKILRERLQNLYIIFELIFC